MKVFERDHCNNCGSEDVRWDYTLTSNSGVQDGRLKYNEIQVKFFLGCNVCSETISVVNADKVTDHLNKGNNK